MKKESVWIRFLYRTITGRVMLKILVKPGFSEMVAHILSSGFSARFIPFFARKNRIDMERFIEPKGGYRSFNDFFVRKLKPEYIRPVCSKLVSPCDGLLTVKRINTDSIIEVKNSQYSIKELLRDRRISSKYNNGIAMIFRLTPAHYHRYCYCSDAKVLVSRRIKGVLHCVRPIALERNRVFTENTREYMILKSDDFGMIIQMEVGAMLVGRISNHFLPMNSMTVKAGMEKGHFEYGGSTIILLFEKSFKLSRSIIRRHRVDGEIPVHIGEALTDESI